MIRRSIKLMALSATLALAGCEGVNMMYDFGNEFLPANQVNAADVAVEADAPPRNVILIVGDGMGVAQVYTSVVAQRGNNSAFLRFPFSGFSRTYCLDKYRTDSGAGGTALMTGAKNQYGHVNYLPDGSRSATIFDDAVKAGMSTGFVVTSSVLDATPASTYGHVSSRHQYDSLSLQMSLCSHSVMIGGGAASFRTENRKDGTSPLDTLVRRGYTVLHSLDSMEAYVGDRLVTMSYDGNPAHAPERGDMLLRGVKKAISILDRNKYGFALMIEGSQIDWACHDTASDYLHAEMADFERMLNYVLDFAERDGNTLVVVTADHETGGVTLPTGDIEKGTNEVHFLWNNHTGVMVPVFSFGPGSQYFSGIQENTDIPTKIRWIMDIGQ